MAGLLGTSWEDPKSQGLLALASGMLQGNMGAGVANMGTTMAGAQDMAMKRKLMDMQMQKGGLELDAERKKLSDAAAAREIGMQYGVPGMAQAAPSGGAGLSADTMAAMPAEFQLPTTAAMPNAAPAGTQSGGSKKSFFDHYSGLAQKLMQGGLPDQAAAAMATAEKYRPKFSTTPQLMKVNGKLTNVLISEDGSTKDLNGYDVKPDMVETDDGATKTWVDKNQLTPGQSVKKQMSPGEVASNTLGWANNAASIQNASATRAIAQAQFGINNQLKEFQLDKVRDETRDRNDQRKTTIAGMGDSIDVLNKAINHPGRETVTGLSGALDPRNYVRGSDARDFQVVVDQIGGKAFLQAFESLKGGGQITEVEGKKATDAMARLNTSQSDSEYLVALEDLKGVMNAGYQRMTGKSYVRPTEEPAKPGATNVGKTASISDIAATAKASGRSTADVTKALRAQGYTIGGQ